MATHGITVDEAAEWIARIWSREEFKTEENRKVAIHNVKVDAFNWTTVAVVASVALAILIQCTPALIVLGALSFLLRQVIWLNLEQVAMRREGEWEMLAPNYEEAEEEASRCILQNLGIVGESGNWRRTCLGIFGIPLWMNRVKP